MVSCGVGSIGAVSLYSFRKGNRGGNRVFILEKPSQSKVKKPTGDIHALERIGFRNSVVLDESNCPLRVIDCLGVQTHISRPRTVVAGFNHNAEQEKVLRLRFQKRSTKFKSFDVVLSA